MCVCVKIVMCLFQLGMFGSCQSSWTPWPLASPSVPVAARWKAASGGTPSRGRALVGVDAPSPDCPASPSGSPAASPSPSTCSPSATPGFLCFLLHRLRLHRRRHRAGPGCRSPQCFPFRHPSLLLRPLPGKTSHLHLHRARPPRWWASPRTSSWGLGVRGVIWEDD